MRILSRTDHFWVNVKKSDECWEWQAGKTGSGYGAYYDNSTGKTCLAHRYAYTLTLGPIPLGKQLDHLCRNRVCVNPNHLEPVSATVNLLRGYGVCANNARKTHCTNGHHFDVLNTRWRPNGGRSCRECARLLSRKRRYNKRKTL